VNDTRLPGIVAERIPPGRVTLIDPATDTASVQRPAADAALS
jgi:hypothetical protein